MATAKKKGLINEAISSKPVVAAKGLVDKAIEAFNDPPLAPETAVRKKARRSAAKKVTAKKAPVKATKGTMDRKLVSAMEDYEVKYLAQKHGVTQKAVKAAVAAVGSSRNKVEAALKRKT